MFLKNKHKTFDIICVFVCFWLVIPIIFGYNVEVPE